MSCQLANATVNQAGSYKDAGCFRVPLPPTEAGEHRWQSLGMFRPGFKPWGMPSLIEPGRAMTASPRCRGAVCSGGAHGTRGVSYNTNTEAHQFVPSNARDSREWSPYTGAFCRLTADPISSSTSGSDHYLTIYACRHYCVRVEKAKRRWCIEHILVTGAGD
jgi:hypothetical protein